MPAESHRQPCPPLWPCMLACAGLALWIDFGSLHRSQHADSLLSALISLYRWMPFYWELDRIGMLVPLVARPIKHPLANLLFQDGLYVFCALAALVLLPRYLLRNATFPIAGMLCVAAFVGLTPTPYRFEYFINTQYGVWLFLGLSSLILLESGPSESPSWPRRIAAAALMALAHWAYCTAAMFLGPLIVFRAICSWRSRADIPVRHSQCETEKTADRKAADRNVRPTGLVQRLAQSELFNSLATLAIGFATGLGLMQLARTHDTNFTSLPSSEWLQTWQSLAAKSWGSLAPQAWPWSWLAAAAIGAIAYCHPAVRRAASTNWRSAMATAAAAVFIGLFIGTRQWVVANQFEFRYLLPSALMLQAGLAGVAVAPLAALGSSAMLHRSYLATIPLALLAAFASYGRPSLAGVYCDLDPYYATAGADAHQPLSTRELLDSGVTHVAGDYWKVWPAVFRANLALHERGERRVVWGVAQRSGPTQRYWKKIPRDQMRVAVAAGGDPQAEPFFYYYQLAPLAVAEKRASLWLLRPAEIVTAEQPGEYTTRR